MASIDYETRTLEKLIQSSGTEHTTGELVRILSNEKVRNDVARLSSLFGPEATVGAVLVQYGLALDNDVLHSEVMRRMDKENMMLWNSLVELNKLLGSNYMLKDVVSK